MPYRTRVSAAAATVAEPKTETMETEMKDVTNTGDQKKDVPEWLSKIKEGGVKKIPKDVQKRRRNFRLKKMLTPKPPMMVLFELVNHADIQFQPFIVDPVSRLMKVSAVYDGQTFDGIGPSKSIAKNICSEHILQHIAFKSCVKADNDGVQDEQENEGGPRGEDDTPWTALASVALFKLFNDWQAQGAVLPSELFKGLRAPPALATGSESAFKEQNFSEMDVPMTEAGVTVKKEKKTPNKPKGPKVLPENPTSRHPVQLLNEMEGQLEYTASQEGAPPSVLYRISVTINDRTFCGSGANKKIAKKNAAVQALAVVHNVHYPDSA